MPVAASSSANSPSRLTTLLKSEIEVLKVESQKSTDILQELQCNFSRLIFISEDKSKAFCINNNILSMSLKASFHKSCIDKLQYFAKVLSSYDALSKSKNTGDYIEYIMQVDYLLAKYGFKQSSRVHNKDAKFYKIYSELILLNCHVRDSYSLLNLIINHMIKKASKSYANEIRDIFKNNKNILTDKNAINKIEEMKEVNKWVVSKLNELRQEAKDKLNAMSLEGENIKISLTDPNFFTEDVFDDFISNIKEVKSAFDINEFIKNVKVFA